jgi:D-alanyl-D-alanine carboxypeptidase
MMSYRFMPVRVLLLLAGAIVIVAFRSSGPGSRAQNRPARTSASERPQTGADGNVVRLSARTKPVPGAGFKPADLAVFDAASSSNVQLQRTLEWSFGGKLQHGWDLYAPLIDNLIGAGVDAGGNEFAMRLSLWQREKGIEPSGVLDGETWSQMVSKFQSRRIAGRPYPAPNQLVTIPISDCYDPTRAEELRSAERETLAAYKRMVAAAVADSSLGLQVGGKGQLASNEKFLKIISAFRSREHQDQLRRQSPNSGSAGLAINSPHSTGRALDLYVGGEPVSTKDQNRALQTQGAVYRWLVKNAARFGFQPYFYEPWHWEYVGVGSTVPK